VEFNIFMFGLIFGSFMNMLIYRLPLGISLIHPKRSICTSCNYQIKWYENIPLLSYIFLRGKCSNCKDKISIVYPLVELITAIISVMIFNKLGLNFDFFIIILIFYTLIILSFIDFKYKAVPDYLLILILIFSFFHSHFLFNDALLFIGAIVLLDIFMTFYIQNIKSRLLKDKSLKEQRSIGEGDVPIIAIIGGIVGIKLGLIAIFLSAIFALLPSIFNLMAKKETETPFIPFLSLGLFVVFILDQQFIVILQDFIK